MKLLHQYSIREEKFALKDLTRREKEQAHIYYAKKESECIREGILTRKLLMREYEKNGGLLSKEETKEIKGLYDSLLKLNVEAQKLKGKKKPNAADKAAQKQIEEQTSQVLEKIQIFEIEREQIFSNTADTIARNYTILWCIVKMFCQWKGEEDKGGEYVRVFQEEDFEEALDHFEEVQDEQTNVSMALERAKTLISLWYSKRILTEEDFSALETYFEADNPRTD